MQLHRTDSFTDEIMDVQVLAIPLSTMKMCGFDPSDNSLSAKVKIFMSFIAPFLMALTSVMEMLLREWSVASFVRKIEAFMAGMQGTGRWFLFFIYKKKVYQMIHECKTFPNINDADLADELRVGDIINLTKKGSVLYAYSCIMTVCLVILEPILFTWKKALPLMAWYPRDSTYGYEIFYVIQVLATCISGFLVVSADTLFGAFCGILIVQFRLLNKKLESTEKIETNKDYILTLRESVIHHMKLIEFGNTLSTVYSFTLVIQYLITLWLTCAELYTVSESMKVPFEFAKSVSILISLLLQMGMYCFLAEAVMNESENTGYAVYKSDWYNRDIKEAGLYVQMIIRRASKPVTFDAGGLVLMGRVAWLNVFKASYSIFTLLSTAK